MGYCNGRQGMYCNRFHFSLLSYLHPILIWVKILHFAMEKNKTLHQGSGYESYLWQDGSTGQVYTVTEAGLYWVTVNNGCGEDTDTIYVEVYPLPEPDLGPDTTICTGAKH